MSDAALVDTIREVETPEGVQLELRLAGPVVRSVAWGIDKCVHGAIYLAAGIVLAPLGQTGMGALLILSCLVAWFYPVFFELLFRGATPGKMLVGIAAVRADGTPLDWTASLLRNTARFADFLPAFYLTGLLSVMLDHDFRRLGDLVAGTVVIYRTHPKVARRLDEGPASAVPVSLTVPEQRAVIEYAERAHSLGPDRAEELAGLLTMVAGEGRGARPERLKAMARWLLGRRS